MQTTILAIVGKPLAGKDTQADLLVAAHPEAVKISPGHIIRAVKEEGETHRFWPIVGHLIPAGTGQREFEDIIVGSQEEYDSLMSAKGKTKEKHAEVDN